MKPRLRKLGWGWLCIGSRTNGFGCDPQEAYGHWKYRDEVQAKRDEEQAARIFRLEAVRAKNEATQQKLDRLKRWLRPWSLKVSHD